MPAIHNNVTSFISRGKWERKNYIEFVGCGIKNHNIFALISFQSWFSHTYDRIAINTLQIFNFYFVSNIDQFSKELWLIRIIVYAIWYMLKHIAHLAAQPQVSHQF